MKLKLLILCLITCSLFITCDSSSSSDDIINEDDNSNNEEEEEIPFDFTIYSFSPEQGKVGDTISILGTNFSNIIEENEITFEGVSANIIYASESQIDVIIPLQLPEGDYSVSLTIQEITKPVGVFNITIDDYKYLSVGSDRRVYTFGNNSAIIQNTGSIEISDFTSIISRTLSNTETKIYGMVNYYSIDDNVLFVYDKLTGLTNEIDLTIPSSIDGSHLGITALHWDEQNSELIGLLDPNYIYPGDEGFHIIKINPITFEVIDTGILTPPAGSHPTGIVLDNNNIYYSTHLIGSDTQRDMTKIDLLTGNHTFYYFDDFNGYLYKMSKANENEEFYAFRTTVGTNAIIPVKIDISQNTVTDITPYNGYTLQAINGNGFYDFNINSNINVIGNDNTGLSIYKFDDVSDELINIDGPTGFNVTYHIIGFSE